MEALHLLIRAGFIIHWEKSSLIPSTDFPFLDFQWNTVQASIAIPQVKIDALHSQALLLSNLTSPTCCQILVLTGLIAAFFKAVPLCLKGRWMQISLNSVYSSEMDLQKTQSSGKERPQLDHQSHPTPVLRPLVESVSRSLQPRGPDGRIQNQLWHMVPRVPSPRPLGQHNHSPSYQCFGEYCFVDLPGLHPSPVVESA
jgi:hypothetical protein